MKKITKFLVVVLSLALLVGAVVGVSVAAAEDGAGEDAKWVVSTNVSYGDNIYLYIAVDSTLATDPSKLTINVSGAPYAEDDKIINASYPVTEQNVDIYEDGSVIAHVIDLPGVAAKYMGDNVELNVWYDGEKVETVTYSVAQYFYERLYENGVVDAVEGDEDYTRKNLYLASLNYGAKAERVLRSGLAASEQLSNKVYLKADAATGLTSGIVYKENYISLPDGIWGVKSYKPDGTVANANLGEGTYYLANNSVVISDIKLPEPEPVEVPVYGFDGVTAVSTATKLNADLPATLRTATSEAEIVTEADGNVYLRKFDESTTAATSNTIIRDFAKPTADAPLMLQLRFKINSTNGKIFSAIRFNNSGGSNIAAASIYTSGSDVIMYKSTGAYNSGGTVNLGAYANQWFTLKIIITVDNQISVYANGDHKATWTSASTLGANIARIYFGDVDKSVTYEMCLDDIYCGPEIKQPDPVVQPTITEQTKPEMNYTVKHTSYSSEVYNITDNSFYAYKLDNNAGVSASAGNIKFTASSKATATDDLVFEAKVKVTSSNSSNMGIYYRKNNSTTNHDGALTKLYSTGSATNFGLGTSVKKMGDFAGQWFNIKLVIGYDNTLAVYAKSLSATEYTEIFAPTVNNGDNGTMNQVICLQFATTNTGTKFVYEFRDISFGLVAKA